MHAQTTNANAHTTIYFLFYCTFVYLLISHTILFCFPLFYHHFYFFQHQYTDDERSFDIQSYFSQYTFTIFLFTYYFHCFIFRLANKFSAFFHLSQNCFWASVCQSSPNCLYFIVVILTSHHLSFWPTDVSWLDFSHLVIHLWHCNRVRESEKKIPK